MALSHYCYLHTLAIVLLFSLLSTVMASLIHYLVIYLPVYVNSIQRQAALAIISSGREIPKKLSRRKHISFWHLFSKICLRLSNLQRRFFLLILLEFITSFFLYYQLGFTLKLPLAFILVSGLITLAFIDIETFMLPDELTLPLLWMGLLINCFDVFTSPTNAILGAVGGYLFAYSTSFVFFKIRKKKGIGEGDFKLVAVLGSWFGWQSLPFILLIASFLGLLSGIAYILLQKKNFSEAIPFGPFLSFAGFILLVYPKLYLNPL